MQYLTLILGTLAWSTQLTKSITVPKAMTKKYNMVYICYRHAQDQYCGFNFESLASVLQKSYYYHLNIGQMIKFYSRWQYDWFSQRKAVFQGVSVVTYTILLCLQIQSSQFSLVCTLERVMVDLSFSRDCTSRNELEKSLKKSIWPPESTKWLGNLTYDVSQHPRQSFSSLQSTDVRIILLWLSQ